MTEMKSPENVKKARIRTSVAKIIVGGRGGRDYLHTEPCTNERGYKGEAVCVEADDFCSYGERKENNNEAGN